MSTVTYDASSAARAGTPAAAPARKGRGLFARLVDRLMESRRKQAMEELRRHGLRLPRELEEAGWKINERNEDSLPFLR